MAGGEVNVATVASTTSTLDNTATLPLVSSSRASQPHCSSSTMEKQKQKEQDNKKSRPHYIYYQLKRTSAFVVLSFLYGKLLIVACLALVSTQEATNNVPIPYFEGFFTYLFGVSIIFLIYLLGYILPKTSSCCGGGDGGKAAKKNAKKKKGDKESTSTRPRPSAMQREVYPRKMKDLMKAKQDIQNESIADSGKKTGQVAGGKKSRDSREVLTDISVDSVDVESGTFPEKEFTKRATTQYCHHYGSFFLRVGAIAFGLGTMIYIGLLLVLEYSGCNQFELLRFVNPTLQMVFTFMQMYFIFMNARLNIHRFKFIARFGLMHVLATNVCVWIRTLIFESLKDIRILFTKKNPSEYFASSVVKSLANEYDIIEKNQDRYKVTESPFLNKGPFDRAAKVVSNISKTVYGYMKTEPAPWPSTSSSILAATTPASYGTISSLKNNVRTYATEAANYVAGTVSTTTLRTIQKKTSSPVLPMPTTPYYINTIASAANGTILPMTTTVAAPTATTIVSKYAGRMLSDGTALFTQGVKSIAQAWGSYDELNSFNGKPSPCKKIEKLNHIMGESAPFLYPIVIEYSLIAAAVIYIMWHHIGRYPKFVSEENIEQKLEIMLNQRAVVLAQTKNGSRTDCIGSSKGLFFGLLLLVGSLICLILFFVLIHHPESSYLAVYLADASHCVVMILSILAIVIGFIRARKLKFHATDTTALNDILLRVSAFGLFWYSLFGIIAGARYAMVDHKNLLILVTGVVNIFQVILQILFIGDMGKRHVYLPEHDRNKPGRQIVTFLLVCNITMWILFTFESQKVIANPVQLDFYGKVIWSLVEHITLPLCIFHRFHSSVALAEIWKNSYKPRIE